MNRIVVIMISLLCLGSCNTKETKSVLTSTNLTSVEQLPYFDSADFTPRWSKPAHRIPEFSFINQNGETITNDDYKGKIYVADFFFTTCPGICPKLEKHMSLLEVHYRDDNEIKFLSHTVMPWVDDVETLKGYEINNDINATKWNLVTGERDALYEIARNGYFADEDFVKTQDESEFIHTENFILVDKEGFIRGVYNGTIELDIRRLMRHIDILKRES